jgi:hypothetical protein
MERRAETWAKKACWRKDRRQEGGKEGGMKSTVSRRPGQAVGAGLFGSIRMLEVSSGRVSTRSSCVFRFLSLRLPEIGSRTEDSGDGARLTADGLNHDLRRWRDDSACVQLEEVLCAGRKVLHDCLASQAMGMCGCVWWSACLAFAWLAWYMSRQRRVAANGKTEAVQCGDNLSLPGEAGLELGLRIWGNFKRARRGQGVDDINVDPHNTGGN